MKRLCSILLATAVITPVGHAWGAEEINVAAEALFRDKAVLSINGKRRTLDSGETSPEGVRLISASSEQAIVEIGGDEIRVRLDGRIVNHFVRGVEPKSISLFPDTNGHYSVDGLINGNGVRFLVDTGATLVAINKDLAKRMGLRYRIDGQPLAIRTASGQADGYHVTFDKVQVRSIILMNVSGVVIDGPEPRVALLGQSFLNRLDMRRAGQRLEISER